MLRNINLTFLYPILLGYFGSQAQQTVLISAPQITKENDTVNKEKEKLLIQHGADPNVFQMTCHGDEQDASECEWAYWPTLLQQQTVDMEWCSKLLKIYVVAHAVCYGMEFEGLGYEMVDIIQ